MDTPKKTTQIGTPISKSKFEDSPVFSYINSLSPIKPVNSIPIAQTFSSLSFASPPSVFTSPHISSHKESRFFRSKSSSDPLKPKVSSRDGSKASEEVADATENFDADASIAEQVSIEPPSDNLEMELPQILKYDCSTPDCHDAPCATGMNNMSLVLSAPRGDNDLSEVAGTDLQKMCNVQAKNETPDWESLISDSTELLIFSSPNDSEAFRGLIQRTSDSQTQFCPDAWPTLRPVRSNFTNDDRGNRANNESEPSSTLPDEAVSNLHRGMRRRCLDFEVPGTRSNKTTSNNKPGCDSSSRCVFPSIGLHLNAIAMSSKDNKASVIHETSFSGKIQISLPVSNALVHSRDTSQETLAHAETETGEDTSQEVEDVSKASAREELNPSSPKKKRRKVEQAGEGESCKRCNCKKSKCLKLYCECFAAGVYCIEPCSCVDCFNKPIHEDTVLATRKQIESRNPLAFAPKVIRSSEPTSEAGDDSSKTPASARHKRGCNCKKSNCLKKYCECYQGGVGCSINCRCEGCKNAFGRKDGSSMAGTEGEQEEENETSEKSGTAKALQNTDLMNEEEQNLGSGLPSTPLPLYIQPLAQMPFSSTRPPPHSLLRANGSSSSSALFNSQTFRKPDNLVSNHSMFDKSFETVAAEDKTEDNTPEILIRSPIATINTVSPNSKRVSPPHLESSGSILGRRSGGRKLILQSIPSFPSLTPQH